MIGERFKADSGEAIRRRSVYTFWKRSMPPPQMTILNAPLRDACIARRERTNTPTQALLLLNEAEYLKAAGQLAGIVLDHPVEQRLDRAWETVTGRLPDENEKAESEKLIADLKDKYSANPALADQLCESLRVSTNAKAEVAAWTMLCSMLYNLDITKTKD